MSKLNCALFCSVKFSGGIFEWKKQRKEKIRESRTDTKKKWNVLKREPKLSRTRGKIELIENGGVKY